MRGFWRGFVYAGRGLALGCGGRNFRVMLAMAAVVAVLAWWLAIPRTQAAVLALSFGLVLSLEIVNTAGEMLVDILCPEHDVRYGRVKDVLAGAVLLAATATAVVGVLLLAEPLWARLSGHLLGR